MHIVDMTGKISSIGNGTWAIETADGNVEMFPDVSFASICTQVYDWLHNQHRIGPALRIPVYHEDRDEFRWVTAQNLADLYAIGMPENDHAFA
jgi:hypothetical protein